MCPLLFLHFLIHKTPADLTRCLMFFSSHLHVTNDQLTANYIAELIHQFFGRIFYFPVHP